MIVLGGQVQGRVLNDCHILKLSNLTFIQVRTTPQQCSLESPITLTIGAVFVSDAGVTVLHHSTPWRLPTWGPHAGGTSPFTM